MKERKPAIIITAGVICVIAAVIWMIAVKASVHWYVIPSFIGGWLIVDGIILLKQNK